MKVEANPFWPHYTDFPKLACDVEAEVAVVGGGIAGVSSAYFLGCQGYKVVLIESNQVGSVATGASSGTLFYGCGSDFQGSIKRLGLDNAKLLFRETDETIREMTALIKKENISCGLRNPDIVYVARDDAETEYVLGEVKASAELGFPGKLLDGDEICDVFTGRRFPLGVEHLCSQIHPGQFIAALSKVAAERYGVQVYENTQMLNCEDVGKKAVVNTRNGKITADKVIVATNIEPFLGLEKHFAIENSTLIPSKPIGGRLKEVFPKDKILQTTEEYYDLFFPWEERVFLEVYKLRGAAEKMKHYFPSWLESDTHDQWGDSWSKTKDMLPILGHVTPNLIAEVAMGDQGIVMGFTCGRKIADVIEDKGDLFTKMLSPTRFGVHLK